MIVQKLKLRGKYMAVKYVCKLFEYKQTIYKLVIALQNFSVFK